MPKPEYLRAGDWVEVKSLEEIRATLDGKGSLDALPFMPEMLPYCGRRFRVFKTAHKTCTPPSILGRRMADTVHLEGLRCDGAAHGGCQAGCLLFWKIAWLRRVDGPGPKAPCHDPAPIAAPELLTRATRAHADDDPSAQPRYRCQATELPKATTPSAWWDPRPYVRDVTSGNVRLWDLLRYGLLAAFNMAMRAVDRWEYPHVGGHARGQTPTAALNLQPGEWVQIRSKSEIEHTLNERLRNRGLWFDVEMVPFCGGTFRVLRRVDRLIDEKSGIMTAPRNPCLILDGVSCGANLSKNRMFCSRSIYPFWHEVWLKRVEQKDPVRG